MDGENFETLNLEIWEIWFFGGSGTVFILYSYFNHEAFVSLIGRDDEK